MPALENARFQDADRYSAYLRSPDGKLRGELAWLNLRGLLLDCGSDTRVLDLGGGTGYMSIRLAKMGFPVLLLDSSEEMLGIARSEAEASRIANRISFVHADATQLQKLFEAESFDMVVCHNLLEYLPDPAAVILQIRHVLRSNGIASALVRNRAGEVLKAAIKSGDCELAKANLSAETVVDSLFGNPVRLFEPSAVSGMLARAGLQVVAEYGVRVFSDYLDLSNRATLDRYAQLLELELILGAEPKFAAIARYTQIMARRCDHQQRAGDSR